MYVCAAAFVLRAAATPETPVAVLLGEVAELRGVVAELQALVAEQAAEIAELRRRLSLNSRKSSKPPSSNGPNAPARSPREPSGHRRGGQAGHEPDHRPEVCERCSEGIAARPSELASRHQVVDVPPIRAHVTEHRVYACGCACGHLTRAGRPAGLPACPVAMGVAWRRSWPTSRRATTSRWPASASCSPTWSGSSPRRGGSTRWSRGRLEGSRAWVRERMLVCLERADVPPDNNASERAIRNLKVKLKVSGQRGGAAGTEAYLALRSVIETAIRRGVRPLAALSEPATLGHPQLYWGLRPGDKGLYVSTGGFTGDARREADRSNTPITLVDLDRLASLLTQYYEACDTDTKSLVPLRKVWWPV